VLFYVFPALCLALSCLVLSPEELEASSPDLSRTWSSLPACACLPEAENAPERGAVLVHGATPIDPPRKGELEPENSGEPEGNGFFAGFDNCSPMGQPVPTEGMYVVTLSDLRIPDSALKEMRTAQKFVQKRMLYRALYHLKRAIKQAPQCAQAYNSLGVVYFKGGHAREAEKAFLRAAELGPASPSAQANLGLLYLVTDRPAEAIHPLEQASMLQPLDAASATHVAEALFKSGRISDAEQWCRRALDLDPGMHRTVHLLCCIYARQMKYREAIDLLREFFNGRGPGADAGQLQQLMSDLEQMVD
jgi:Tfp pilus assembly protein PilF